MPELEIQLTGDVLEEELDASLTASIAPSAPPNAVPTPSPTVAVPTSGPALPTLNPALDGFEGAPVHRTEIRIAGAVGVDTRDEVTVSIDDRLRVCGEFRVIRVSYFADKNGQLVRQHVIAPIADLELVPWDSGNPSDDGIIRAR